MASTYTILKLSRIARNKNILQHSCGWNAYGQDNSEAEIGLVVSAVQTSAQLSGLDPRFVFAIVMQESKGCVRVKSTKNAVHNPGLMQSFNGVHSCNQDGVPQLPCPEEQITGMIRDGVGFTNGNGLIQLVDAAIMHNRASGGTTGLDKTMPRVYYQAARLYNSGSTAPNWADLNDGQTATPAYALDIANRLVGWIDPT